MKRFLTASILAFALSLPAQAQTPTTTEPKIVLTNINFYRPTPTSEYFDGNASLALTDSQGKQTTFNVSFSHVKTIQEAEDQIKPEIDRIASDIKKAADGFERHH